MSSGSHIGGLAEKGRSCSYDLVSSPDTTFLLLATTQRSVLAVRGVELRLEKTRCKRLRNTEHKSMKSSLRTRLMN